jgi:methyl-accepting chemotaxis protein
MLEKINSQMSLGGRLTIISGVFVASTVFGAALYGHSALTDINFTTREEEGVHALPHAWKALSAPGQLEEADHIRQSFGADAAVDALAKAQSEEDRLKAGRALIMKIADSSNLTLDPDLDSYYAMDAVTVRLPKLKQAVFELQGVLAREGTTIDEPAFAISFDHLDYAADEAAASLTSSMDYNSKGETRRALAGPAQRMHDKAEVAIATATEIAKGRGDRAALQAQLQDLSAEVDSTWQVSWAELDRLLDVRWAKVQRDALLNLALIVLALGAAGFLSWSVANGLSKRLRALLSTMDALTSGKKDVDIPCLKDTNETGKIGRTLEQFKRSLIENEEAERRSAEEKIRAEEARRQSEKEAQERAQGLVVEAFGSGMDALASGIFSYRINQQLPEAYEKLRDDFHLALQKLEAATHAAENAARQREEDQRTAEEQRKIAEAEAIAAAERMVVGSFGKGMSALAAGDLTYRITSDVPDAYEQLRADFNAAVASMQEAMAAISRNASGVRGGASEVAQAADDLSRRTEHQAATLEETAAALDQVTVTVRKTAQGAARANDLVDNTKVETAASGEVMLQAVSAMSEIEKSSHQISQIIGVIDEIAFQTNLLALNAGVEAARAGDAGRGFAVVASEVRALAQRSSDAAKEIKTLISASSQQVGAGVKLVDQAGGALQKIVAQVTEISALVSEISASANEQSSALGEVNTAVNQMDQATQQNAAMVEETTAASRSLSGEADELSALVARFRVEDGSAELRPSAARERKPAAHPVAALQTRVAAFSGRKHAAGALKTLSREDDWESF